jgi:hypothetical protein
VRLVFDARVRVATELWGGVQVQWRDGSASGPSASTVWAATGGEPRPRDLPFLRGARGRAAGPSSSVAPPDICP